MSAISPAVQISAESGPIRVMIVEDSVVVRSLLRQWLEAVPTIRVVDSCRNGRDAVDRIEKSGAEVVILDIEMPEMDGLTALPELLKRVPELQVIMASTLTKRNADISLRALSMGAVDYIAKPESLGGTQGAETFREDLLRKVSGLGEALRHQKGLPAPSAGPATQRPAVLPRPSARTGDIRLRPAQVIEPEILAIGSSTGGPQALQDFLRPLARKLTVPVVIVQHMPPTFTSILAEHLNRSLGVPCTEAKHGEILEAGRIYIAPGDNHLVVTGTRQAPKAELNQGIRENYCRPSVDPMFRSVASLFGNKVLAVVLTGMGSDGAKGASSIAEAGGVIFAQDEASSVVWGMPGAVANAGLASAVDPIPELSKKTLIMLGGSRP